MQWVSKQQKRAEEGQKEVLDTPGEKVVLIIAKEVEVVIAAAKEAKEEIEEMVEEVAEAVEEVATEAADHAKNRNG